MKYLLMAVWYNVAASAQPVGPFEAFNSLANCEKVAAFITAKQTPNEADSVYYYCQAVGEPSAFVCGLNLFWHRDCYGYRLTR